MQNKPRLALCLEQTLGHRAHGLNLEAAAAQAGATVHRVEYEEHPRIRAPWAVRGSWQAAQALRGTAPVDVSLFHTSTISLFAGRAQGRYVVSADATGVQLDAMGAWYQHARGPAAVERAKRAWYRHVFVQAAALVAWSKWAARSFVNDYGVDGSRILVAHPGAPAGFFELERDYGTRRPRVLFVGGDFKRKGGDLLLEAFAPLAKRAELVIVTDAQVPVRPGVRVVSGIRPGTAEQRHVFAAADIFCLPTRGDCTPVVLGEAMAAGLPVVTTRAGSNGETVRAGETGFLVPPDNVAMLSESLRALVDDAGLRERLGRNGRSVARERMDAGVNARKVIDWMRAVA